MKKFAALIILCLMLLSLAFGQVPPVLSAPIAVSAAANVHELTAADVEAFLDGIVPLQLEREDVAGATVAVVKDGKTLFVKGYGYADVKHKQPVTAETLFRPGSVSKLFTADKRSPNLGNHLKTHIPNRLFASGTTPAYSNYGAALAGYVVERVSGQPYWDCPSCKSRNDRDVNAAKNIRDEALRFLALGTSAAASGGTVSRGGKISVLSDAVPLETGSYPLSVSGG
jgi:Beta-lactamase